MLLDRIGLSPHRLRPCSRSPTVSTSIAERCGPAIATYSNPAKTLAAELADSLPLIWTEGAAAGPAGRRFAAVLAELAGRPALAAELPEALSAHGALLAGRARRGMPTPTTSSATGWTRQQALHARVVLLRDRPTGGLTAAPAARELALGHDTAVSELEPEEGNELEALAELLAVTDFAAVYLALASGIERLESAGQTRHPPARPSAHLTPTANRTQKVPCHGPPRQHRAPLRLGLHHRHPGAARHRAHRRAAGRDVDGRAPRRTLPRRPRRGPRRCPRSSTRPRRANSARPPSAKFGPRLPFLLKILAAGAPLSLQVHPDLAQAKEGYADEERRGDPGRRRAPQLQGRQPQARTDLRAHPVRRAVRLPRTRRRPPSCSPAWTWTPSSRTSTSCAPTPRRRRCARYSPPY